MNLQRIGAAFYARSLEFLRDRSTLAWNLILPVALVAGLAFVFSDEGQPLFKVAVIGENVSALSKPDKRLHPILETKHIDFYGLDPSDKTAAIGKVGRHQIDMLLDLRPEQMAYWINEDSPRGYFLKRLIARDEFGQTLQQQQVAGKAVRYVDWVVPGILGMNMMFSCLFGVGFVIVRYRKSAYLKRLNATPLRASEFLLAQVLSRLILVVSVTTLVFTGTHLFLHFTMEGHYWHLFLVLLLGTFNLISLSLLVAARVTSEELASGLLNLLTWPMLLLSGVWFSLEGTNPYVQAFSQLSPLTHILSAARAIMLDGADLADISTQLTVLGISSLFFLSLGSYLFKWTDDQ